ncbi:MAG TPA: hypothetical protein VGK78_11490 [Nocardioides sp.]|uniref:hypothetical protein n=1 Tax=Nocardioides sp. TaxID=35761 RepID=UPI002F41A1DA
MTTPPITPPIIPPITRVTGGVAGLAATYAAVRALADRFDAAGDHLREHAGADARVLTDPDLLESAPLSPVTFAEAEAQVVDATSGLHGVVEASVVYEADAVLVRATVTAYQESDRLVARSFQALDYIVGHDLGCALSAVAPELLLLGMVAVPVWQHLPDSTRRRLGDPLEEWADEHPEAVQHAVDGSGGLLDGLLTGVPLVRLLAGIGPFHPTLADAASDLAGLYPAEGPPRVRRRGDLHVPLGQTPPDDLAGLIRHLDETNRLSPHDRPGDQGTVEIQTLHAADGTVRHVVYLPGTDDLTTTPWSHDEDVRDLPADLRVIAGDRSTYATGIEEAMKEAGIGRHDPVLLVGHSLGGMEAASLLAHGSGFDVTHVVTAGSPIGGLHQYPPGTHVLSLENRGDLVPLLDGRDNADSVQQVTMQFDDHETSIAGNHDLQHYVRGAAAADASTDASVREQLASLRAHGFLGSAGGATSQVFQISR